MFCLWADSRDIKRSRINICVKRVNWMWPWSYYPDVDARMLLNRTSSFAQWWFVVLQQENVLLAQIAFFRHSSIISLWNCWQNTSNSKQGQLWLFLLWFIEPWRFYFCKKKKKKWQSIVSGLSWKTETLLSIFSGLHNQEVNPENRKTCQVSNSHWTYLDAIFAFVTWLHF